MPGIGSQAGDLENSVKLGLGEETHNLLISSSRGIIYASDEPSTYGDKAAEECSMLRDKINNILTSLDRSFI